MSATIISGVDTFYACKGVISMITGETFNQRCLKTRSGRFFNYKLFKDFFFPLLCAKNPIRLDHVRLCYFAMSSFMLFYYLNGNISLASKAIHIFHTNRNDKKKMKKSVAKTKKELTLKKKIAVKTCNVIPSTRYYCTWEIIVRDRHRLTYESAAVGAARPRPVSVPALPYVSPRPTPSSCGCLCARFTIFVCFRHSQCACDLFLVLFFSKRSRTCCVRTE